MQAFRGYEHVIVEIDEVKAKASGWKSGLGIRGSWLRTGRYSGGIGFVYAKPTDAVLVGRQCRALCRKKLKPCRNGPRYIAKKLSHCAVPLGHQDLDAPELADAIAVNSVARTRSEDIQL